MSVVASDEVENTGGFAKSRSFYSSFCFSPSSLRVPMAPNRSYVSTSFDEEGEEAEAILLMSWIDERKEVITEVSVMSFA